MNRSFRSAVSVSTALALVLGLPGLPLYEASAQIVAPKGVVVEGPSGPGLGVGPDAAWQLGQEQIVSYTGFATLSPEIGVVSLEAAALGPASLAVQASRSLEGSRTLASVRAKVAVAAAKRFERPVTASERAATGRARTAEFRAGRSLAENLQGFGAYWQDRSKGLNAASDEDLGARGDADFQKLLGAPVRDAVASVSVTAPLTAALAKPAPALHAGEEEAPEVPLEKPAEAGDAAKGDGGSRAPPKVKLPFGAQAKYHASYWGAVGGTFAAFGLLVASLSVLPSWAIVGGAGLLLGNLLMQDMKQALGGGKELYTVDEVRALAAQQKDPALRASLETLGDSLESADEVLDNVSKRAGVADKPLVGWYRPVPYNLSSWGNDPASGWIGLGELVLNSFLRKDWRTVAGALAHELGHLQLGDWKRFIALDKLTERVFQLAGVHGVVRHLTHRRALTGEQPWKDRYSFGVVTAAALGALKLTGLVAVPWLALGAIPAAWTLLVGAALLKQVYLRAQELRADQFSAKVTHPSYMISYLLELLDRGVGKEEPGASSWFASHPSTLSRIRALDPEFQLPETEGALDGPRYRGAVSYLESLELSVEQARADLEKELGKDAVVQAAFEGGRFAFVVEGVPKGSLEKSYREVSVVEREDGRTYQPASAQLAQLKSELAAAVDELKGKVGVDAVVEAVHDGSGFLISVDWPNATDEQLDAVPAEAGRYPVVLQQ